jgi:hypothetical protein
MRVHAGASRVTRESVGPRDGRRASCRRPRRRARASICVMRGAPARPPRDARAGDRRWVRAVRARGTRAGDFDFLSQAPEMSQTLLRTRARGGSRFWSLDHWRSRAFDTLRQLFHTIFRCCTAFLLASPARNSQSPKFSVALTKSVVFCTVFPVENHGENKEPTPI